MNVSASLDYSKMGRVSQRATNEHNLGKLVFHRDDAVLDVGCGTGDETKLVAAKVKTATGIDPSDKMLAVAREINSAPNVTFVSGDAQTVGENPDWQESFDKVLCLFVLHWIQDKAAALRSTLACLKPGGVALFVVPNRTTLLVDTTEFLHHHPRWGPFVKDFKSIVHLLNQTPSECKEFFLDCGWTDVQCETQDSIALLSEAETKSFFKTVIEQSALIPEDETEAYLDDMWRWARDRYPGNVRNDAFLNPVEKMTIFATKPGL